MSFDARSRERLEALGRTLPQKLPPPAPRPAGPPSSSTASGAPAPRHPLESEQDPEALFHALIQASPDGTVPSHLLDRLRSLEQARPASPAPTVAPTSPGSRPAAAAGSPTPPPRTRRGGPTASAPGRRASASDRDLYDAFEDLLRSEGDDSPEPLPPRRQPDARLLPRPTLRSERPA